MIERENPHVYADALRARQAALFPQGDPGPDAEAKEKAKRYDATIGIARENGKPMFLPSVMRYFNDSRPAEALTYAPATGRPDLRKKWREELLRKNPSLAGKSFSTPIVTSGVTHALSLVGDLFVDKGDMVLLPDKFWENYELLFGVRCQAQLALYPFFNAGGGFNVEALRQALATRAGSWKTILILNFPNNPTGYSITKSEADQIVDVLREAAEDGRNLVVVTDDAYFGLFYDEDVLQESLFARLAGCHERILAVKVDGPTKEEFVWGFRTGMLTFSAAGVLQRRSALRRPGEEGRRGDPQRDLQLLARRPVGAGQGHGRRSDRRRATARRKGFSRPGRRRCTKSSAAQVRRTLGAVSLQRRLLHVPEAQGARRRDVPQALLEKYGVGVIADGDRDIRIAFSSVEAGELADFYGTRATACVWRSAQRQRGGQGIAKKVKSTLFPRQPSQISLTCRRGK